MKTKAKRSPDRKAATKGAARVHELEQRLAESLERERAKDRALVASLEQQTATAEILRAISRSRADLQPVFDAIVHSAGRLCDAAFGALQLFDGECLTLDSHYGISAQDVAMLREQVFPLRPDRGSSIGRAVISRAVVHIADIRTDPEYRVSALQSREGYRTALSVPMLRGDAVVGVINLWRRDVRPFSDSQVHLVETFADQAVIAIENVRLFKELEARSRDLKESLDRQTATADILRAVSQAQTDVQPVFEAIADSTVRLFGAWAAAVGQYDGELVSLVAARGGLPGSADAARERFQPPHRPSSPPEQSVLTKRVHHVLDIETDPSCTSEFRRHAAERGIRSVVAVPMLRGSDALGMIVVSRAQSGGFSPADIALLQTFADQAVIAVENARLLTELQASNRELTTALGTQTATSDILRVISRSQTDVQPVFDAIVQSAVRLLRARSGTLSRIVGDQIELAAHTSTDDAGDAATRAAFPQPLHFAGVHAQTIRNRTPLNIGDAHTDARLPEATHLYAQVRGYRSQIVVPMLRHDEAVGAIAVTRREPGGFTDDEVALLQTFADQAVIAIENARLLTELQARTQDLTRSVDQLTALGDVGRAVSSSLDLETVLTTIVSRAVQLAGVDGGVVFEYDETAEEFLHRAATEQGGALTVARRTQRIRKGEGVLGQTAITLEPVQVEDISAAGAYESRLRGILIASGIRGLLAVPMVREGKLIGSLVVSRNSAGRFAPDTVELLRTFATQSALAIQNARLFRELEIKSRELEVASQHKSEFLASMSHELRTPLNAIIGFSDVLLQGMFGDTNEKQTEYLRDILASGQHLLSLINDILDLSKIEAGRMDLDVSDFHLPTAVDDALLLMRERASRRGITLELHVEAHVAEIRADQRKVKQVLLNLLSNAVKFTPEGGRIDVRADVADDHAEISVTDTGIGIAPEDHDAVFEEFRQVGKADKKAEGTGLGLALCRKFVELHGGRIWVKSEIGVGATFKFTLPLRQ